jgi:signal transduction histidine kinase/ActR/RegA family two-component response regulator
MSAPQQLDPAEADFSAALADQRLLEAIDALPEGIVFLDPEGRYRLWNKRYAEIYHGSADLFRVGARLEDTLRIGVYRGQYPEAIGREEEWLAERLSKLLQPGSRHEQRLADGRWILIEERRTSDGGAIGIRIDITDLKLAEAEAREARERAEAANRAKSAFLANMSHEVRTPLNGILGLAQVLLKTPLDPSQSEILSTIVSSASCLDRILSDVLDLSRAESGRLEIRNEPFEVERLVGEAAQFFESQAHDKGLRFEVDYRGSRDPVLGDSDRIRQILWNLLGNALKFTAVGRIQLSVHQVEVAGMPFHRFVVSDTGVGFDPSAALRLFERFEQADSSITRKHGGSGLGLAICRDLVALMDGRIWADGALGRGAAFTVELPLPPTPGDVANVGAASDAPGDERPRRLLLAEDNAVNRKVVELALSTAGRFDIDMVENGRAAVELAASGVYDLILMDINMPEMDGLAATRAIRARETIDRRPRTPLVVLSANVGESDIDASRAAGSDAHLGKPFDLAELISTVVAMSSQYPQHSFAAPGTSPTSQ